MAVQASAAVGDVCPGPPRVLPINSLESADPWTVGPAYLSHFFRNEMNFE